MLIPHALILTLGVMSAQADALGAVAPVTALQVIQVLDQTVDWYRMLGLQQQAAGEPSDLLILYDNRQTANQVIGLAFEIARANADLLVKSPATAQRTGDESVSSHALLQLKKRLDAGGVAVQARIDAARRFASPGKRLELQSELDLINTKKSILGNLSEFVNGGSIGSGSSALVAQIDAMAAAIPSAGLSLRSTNGASPASETMPALTAINAVPVVRSGLWDLAANVLRLSGKIATVDSIDARTRALQTTLTQMRAPLIGRMKALSARGDALAARADTADSTTLTAVHEQLDELAAQFRRTSAPLIPLSKEGVLLIQYRVNLAAWHETIKGQYRDAWKTLGIRLGMLLLILSILFGAAALWRRAVLRYVQDSRRRYQSLLVQRICLWSVVLIVIGMAFASELGSIVTFAGLIAAGVVVAMQSVLVSMVGYFFLIGKHGIRVGDRVQIGEVTGEVIDVGLVRLHLMELGGHGLSGPTGRVVAFANSIVFQVSIGLFKQIPGVNFAWHEMTLTLPPGADYAAIKEQLAAAVSATLENYRVEILRQSKEIQRTTASNCGAELEPQVQLHFAATGVEALVRYPVHLPHAAEIDERTSQALLHVILNFPAATVGGAAGYP